MAFFAADDADKRDAMRSFMGPGHVDQQIRQAIQLTWMMLPDDRKNVAEVERVIREMVDRALKDYQEDAEAFGQGK